MRRFTLAAVLALFPSMVAADSALYGSWHSQHTEPTPENAVYAATFFDDGQFEMTAHIKTNVGFWIYWGVVLDIDTSSMDPVEQIALRLSGTWHTKGDSLLFDPAELEMTIDSDDFFQVLKDLLVSELHAAFVEAEGREATEEEKTDLGTVAGATVVVVRVGLINQVDEEIDGLYRIEGDMLTVVEGGPLVGGDVLLTRERPPSAVEAVSWGQVKRALRP